VSVLAHVHPPGHKKDKLELCWQRAAQVAAGLSGRYSWSACKLLLQVRQGEHSPAPRLPPSTTRPVEKPLNSKNVKGEPNILKLNIWPEEGSDRSSGCNLNKISCSNYWWLVSSAECNHAFFPILLSAESQRDATSSENDLGTRPKGQENSPSPWQCAGWDGQEEGLAVNMKQEFAIESVDKSQRGTASCLSNASAATIFV